MTKNERLIKALEMIANASIFPDDKKWYDEWGDPIDIDMSNSGDWKRFGYDMGVWTQAKLARACINEIDK